jgi:hypothetical protein
MQVSRATKGYVSVLQEIVPKVPHLDRCRVLILQLTIATGRLLLSALPTTRRVNLEVRLSQTEKNLEDHLQQTEKNLGVRLLRMGLSVSTKILPSEQVHLGQALEVPGASVARRFRRGQIRQPEFRHRPIPLGRLRRHQLSLLPQTVLELQIRILHVLGVLQAIQGIQTSEHRLFLPLLPSTKHLDPAKVVVTLGVHLRHPLKVSQELSPSHLLRHQFLDFGQRILRLRKKTCTKECALNLR